MKVVAMEAREGRGKTESCPLSWSSHRRGVEEGASLNRQQRRESKASTGRLSLTCKFGLFRNRFPLSRRDPVPLDSHSLWLLMFPMSSKVGAQGGRGAEGRRAKVPPEDTNRSVNNERSFGGQSGNASCAMVIIHSPTEIDWSGR